MADVKPLTPDEERDLRIDLGDRSEKPDHAAGCQCQECREADDARDMLRIFATLDVARAALVKAEDEARERCDRDGCNRDARWAKSGYEGDVELRCAQHKPKGLGNGFVANEQPTYVQTIRAALPNGLRRTAT